jgi:phospholipid/cholesterol/gamma-HCH transport system ATP-binding protein
MIELSNIHKSFGEKKVLRGISFVVEEGQTTCIIGKSGCGKSVLLKHIVGLLQPDIGSVTLNGANISSLTQKELFAIRRTVGFVFQGAALFDSMTVFENVIIGMYEHGEKNVEVLEAEAKRVLAAVGLLPDIEKTSTEEFEREWGILKEKKPSDLSGGMKKRVGVARALTGSPKYIFYDEPTTGLDPVTSEQIDILIADLAKKYKVTSLVITHDMFSVYRIAHQVKMLDQGLVRFSGSVDELRASTDPVVSEFIERFS